MTLNNNPSGCTFRLLCNTLIIGGFLASAPVFPADHGDAPLISNDAGADIADVYAFVDPNDNNFLVMIISARGFITPGESENLGFFQDNLNWRFAIETTGDANPDFNAEVRFSSRTGFLDPQLGIIRLRQGTQSIAAFTAPTTPPSATQSTAPPFMVTTDPASGISFFAGMTDDPFFFDVPAELQFRQSLINSPPIPPGQTTAPGAQPEVFDRSLDTFAGFNVMSVALRLPLPLIGADDHTFLGVSGYTEPTQFTIRSRPGGSREIGRFVNVDRMGIPGINTLLLPFLHKDRYNRGSTAEDTAGVYVNAIVDSLSDLKTTGSVTANPQCAFDGSCPPGPASAGGNNIGFLASLGVQNGDMLRLNTQMANTGPQGGINTGAGFPNGRRLADDPIDVIVNVIANQLFDDAGGLVDNVNSNDRMFMNTFPFLAPPHQPAFGFGPSR